MRIYANDKIVGNDNPLPVSGNVQLSGSYVGYSTDDKGDIAPNPNRGDTFIELDTKLIYFFDGSQWVVW